MKRVSLVLLAMLVMGVSTAYATPTLNIDFYGVPGWDQGVMDTYQTVQLIPADNPTLAVDLYLSDADIATAGGLAGYGLRITWDSSIVQFAGSSFTVPTGWMDMGSSFGQGYLDVTTLHFPPYPTTSDILLAHFTLSCAGASGISPITVYDLTPGEYADTMYADGTVIDNMLPVTVGYVATPIPAAIWILGSGLLGLLGLRRKYTA